MENVCLKRKVNLGFKKPIPGLGIFLKNGNGLNLGKKELRIKTLEKVPKI